MNDIYSFYQLISKYKIEIPIIQRDYAQGRKDSKAEDVRKSMVADMIAAVKGEKKLFFDFVYGRIDHHVFIPFDGQQRLTTLFLFHKYVFEKCISCSTCEYKSNCICKDVLLRFSYATRQSSREFCERLVKENVIPDNTKSLSKNIRNMQWFYSDWEKDPTIMGMLTMLDEIHNQFSKQNINDYKTLAEKLTSGCDCPVTFHFVDMGEHKLSDETYVKMNARGKTLTPFENFKASLEQYLEKEKEKYNMSSLKENADGKWLDLFWRVFNEGKGEKILPDDAIMSFINRHFINVWRCWYGVNNDCEKQKEYDSFNQRIIEDMPLYPKKDDFVSWDIYQNVLDNCGISKCLTPIFNIWDKLCEQNQDNINEDCQATWNRGDGKEKWNLYVGIINNDNRETYPSRVAFYALLRYFGVQNEKNKTTLSQWMRIVWNIIENSAIDSPDKYQAALRLIGNLSEKCHDIHDALANHFGDFKLGFQYHAQEQVKEEIAKAKQILNGKTRPDGKTWEEIIVEAEKYAFFKGAIRFLFTKEVIGDDWCDFDTKWVNAQKYFDEDGVKDGKENDKLYKSNAILMKSLLANCDDFEHKIKNHFEFSNDYVRWRRILIADHWRRAVDTIMSKEVTTETTKDYVNNTKDVFIKNIIDDGLMVYVCNNMSGAWIRTIPYYNYQAIWINGRPNSRVDLNPILSNLKLKGLISYRNTEGRDSTIPKCRYYKCFGKNVDFKYKFNDKDYYFNWWGTPNETELDVYLTEDNWNDYKKRPNPTSDKGTDEDIYYCFRVTEDMENNTSLFIKGLKELIEQSQKS